MKITVWGINYLPEPTGIAPYNAMLCQCLRDCGHDVRMITSFAYYPAWRKQPSERWRLYRTDHLEGVPVHRCWHYVPRRVSILKRGFHEVTFVVTSLLRQLTLPRPDLVVVVSPPLLLGAAAWLLTRFKRTRYVFHVQDLQPEAAASLGMLKSAWLLRPLLALERLAYAKAALVSGITSGMVQEFGRKGMAASRCCCFPNPVVLPELSSLPRSGSFRRQQQIPSEDFLVVYSGNLGVKQGLDVLIEAASHLRDDRLRVVICGDGSQGEHLLGLVRDRRAANVTMLPLQPEERYRAMLVDADLGVVTQQHGSGRCFFPSKLLNLLAHAKPVLTVADETSELALAVAEGHFGVNVPPGQPEKLAEALRHLARQPERLERFGQAGRQYVERFQSNTVLSRYEAALRQMVEASIQLDWEQVEARFGEHRPHTPENVVALPQAKQKKAA